MQCKKAIQCDSVACRGGARTGRRPRASKTGGHPKSEIKKFKYCRWFFLLQGY